MDNHLGKFAVANKAVKQTGKKLSGAAALGAGPGRPKGSSNKNTAALKDMILEALHGVGGVEYLIARAEDKKTQVAFLTLIGKVLPMQVTGPGAEGEHLFAEIVRRIVKP